MFFSFFCCGVLLKIHGAISVKNKTEGCCKLSVITQHCSTPALQQLSPVGVCLPGPEPPRRHRAEAGARPGLRVVRVQPRVQREVRHLLIWKKQLFYFSRWLWPWHEAGAESYELRLVWGFYCKPKLISNTLKMFGRSQDFTFSLVAIMFLSECGHDFLIHDQNGKHSHTFSVRTKSDSLDLLSHSDVQYPTTTRWWHKNQT